MATTASTVDKKLFPTLFSVNQVTTALNPLRIKMMKYFGWERVGTIAFQDDMSTSVWPFAQKINLNTLHVIMWNENALVTIYSNTLVVSLFYYKNNV